MQEFFHQRYEIKGRIVVYKFVVDTVVKFRRLSCSTYPSWDCWRVGIDHNSKVNALSELKNAASKKNPWNHILNHQPLDEMSKPVFAYELQVPVEFRPSFLRGKVMEAWRREKARWWFQIFVIFAPIWGRFPVWLIFFKGVETTNKKANIDSSLLQIQIQPRMFQKQQIFLLDWIWSNYNDLSRPQPRR